MRFSAFFMAILLFTAFPLWSGYGQDVPVTPPDTLKMLAGTVEKPDLEGPVSYEAQMIDILFGRQLMVLQGRAKVSYLTMVLNAAKITLDWEKNVMTAEGMPDTVWIRNESGDSLQTVQLAGKPEFIEEGDRMVGEVMTYSFETRKGRVLRGRTSYQDGFYTGEAMKMPQQGTMDISNATFTTCDLEEDPHFHFWCGKTRLEVDKKVVAKPVVMFLGKIPVMILPFIYFPIEKGRRSGLIFPRYGESEMEGQYLRGLGYYWAASDYWDVQGTVDYFQKSGFLFRADLNYQVRYMLRGSISGSWTRKDFEVSGVKERRWDLSINHAQTFSPTMSLTINGQFISSGNFYRDLSASREIRMQQEIRSNATLTKRFAGSRSLTVNLSQTRNLETDEVTETLPRISFRAGQTSIIPKPKLSRDIRWYHSIYASYNSQVLYQRKTDRQGSGDEAPLIETYGAGWDHDLRISAPQKLFGWLTVSPAFNYNETWFDRRKMLSLDPESNTVETGEEKGFFARRTFDATASVSTKIYGLVRPGLFESMLRHVMIPSLSFRYQPDFSKEPYRYYDTVEDTAGGSHTLDRYSGSIFGSTPSGGQQSLNVAVQNLFQMKIGDGDKAKKYDLFNWNFSTAYNWKASLYRLSDFSSTIRSTPVKNIQLNFRTTHSFYQVDDDGRRVNRLLVDEVDWKNLRSIFTTPWSRLTQLNASIDVRLKGRAKSGASQAAEAPAAEEPALSDLRNMPGDRLEMDESLPGFDIPWDLSASLNYSKSMSNPQSPSEAFWLNTSVNFNLTKKWKISYTARLDILKKQIVSQDIVFYRDLHCWEARFVWTPTGPYKRFYFRINVKSSMLRDLKVEKGTGRTGIYGY